MRFKQKATILAADYQNTMYTPGSNNKSSLFQVSTKEGQTVSAAHGASFSEASVADNSGDLYRCVDRLLAEVRTPQRTRKFSVTKMLGSLIGKDSLRIRVPRRQLLEYTRFRSCASSR